MSKVKISILNLVIFDVIIKFTFLWIYSTFYYNYLLVITIIIIQF